jgi:hypothetical protein
MLGYFWVALVDVVVVVVVVVDVDDDVVCVVDGNLLMSTYTVLCAVASTPT